MSTQPRSLTPPAGAAYAVLLAAALATIAALAALDGGPGNFSGVLAADPAQRILLGMLSGMAAVLISPVAPARIGRPLLGAGAACFFTFLGYALLHEIRF